MYLDLNIDAHRRFAAYQTAEEIWASGGDPDPYETGVAARIERELGLKEEDLRFRMSQAARSSSDSRYASNSTAKSARAQINAQMTIEANKLALAREQMEKIGIPTLQLQQWTAAKQNEIAQLGVQLDYLSAYSEYQSNPDMYFIAKSFKGGFQNLANSSAGLDPFRRAEMGPAANQSQEGLPTPQSLQSLVSDLTGGTGAGAASVDQANATAAAGTPGNGGANPAAGGNSAAQAIAGLVNANPPSLYEGMDENDINMINNIASIYSAPGGLRSMPLNSLETMNPVQRKLLLAGGRRLGRSNEDDLYNYAQNTWSSGSASAA